MRRTRSALAVALLPLVLVWVVAVAYLSGRPWGAAAEQPSQDVGSSIGRMSIKLIDKSRFFEPAQDRAGRAVNGGVIQVRLDVLDPAGAPVPNLKREQIRVTEDGVPCRLVSYSGPESQPVNIILVMDRSGSMNGKTRSGKTKLAGSQESALALLKELKPERDRVGIIVFDNKVEVLTTFHLLDHDHLKNCQDAVSGLTTQGGTDVGTPTLQALQMLEAARCEGSKLVLVMTDGRDGGQLAKATPKIRERCDQGGIALHSVGFGRPGDVDATTLTAVADECHGAYHFAPSAEELAAVYRACVREILNETSIVYVSPFRSDDGLPRRVAIEVNTPQGKVSSVSEYQIGPLVAGGNRAEPLLEEPPEVGAPASATPVATGFSPSGLFSLVAGGILLLLGLDFQGLLFREKRSADVSTGAANRSHVPLPPSPRPPPPSPVRGPGPATVPKPVANSPPSVVTKPPVPPSAAPVPPPPAMKGRQPPPPPPPPPIRRPAP